MCRRLRFLCRANESAEGTDHSQDAGNIALVKGMHGDARSNQIGSDRRLKVGKSKNKVRLKRKNLRDVCRGERRDTRLLAPHLRRTHGIAGDADDTILFAEKVESKDALGSSSGTSMTAQFSMELK